MHQRQAGSYARRFSYGKQTLTPPDLQSLGLGPGIGLIPPEFDDIDGGEIEVKEDLGNHEAKAAE
jgi:hypothetical protein